MRPISWQIILIILNLLLLNNPLLAAQDPDLDRAITLSQGGQYEEAENIFSAIDSAHPVEGFSFYIARGYNFSWWGKYDKARENFEAILKLDPEYVDAVNGLAYTATWEGQYAAAVHIYNRTLSIDPQNRSALFGLAYNYIQGENIEGARYVADQIIKIFPTDAESHYLSGLVALKELSPEVAKKAFKNTLTLNPQFTAAKEQLGKLVKTEGKWQAEAWYGFSKNAQQLEQGLRRLQLQYQFDNKNLIYLLYDNSLILDNSFLSLTERIAPLYAVGGKYGWTKNFFTKIELANRNFNSRPDQLLINVEHNYFFSSVVIAKLITQYDDRQTEKLGLLGLALDVGLGKHFRMEGTLFHNKNFTFENSTNQRYQISAKILAENFEFIVGTYYDLLKNADSQEQKLAGVFALSTFPIYKHLRGKLFLNYDRGLFDNRQTIGAVGLNYYL